MTEPNKLVDLSYLEELSGGDPDYIAQVVSIFLEHSGRDLLQLNRLATKKIKDWDQIYRQAHKLKSGLGVVKITGMLEDIRRIEELVHHGDKAEIPDITDKLLATFREAEVELIQIIGDRKFDQETE